MNCLVSSLTQIILDPYFRTKFGFQSLVQKEWVAMGHPFANRLGHVLSKVGWAIATLVERTSNCQMSKTGSGAVARLFAVSGLRVAVIATVPHRLRNQRNVPHHFVGLGVYLHF